LGNDRPPRLEHQHVEPELGELLRRPSARDARSDDDRVVGSSRSAWTGIGHPLPTLPRASRGIATPRGEGIVDSVLRREALCALGGAALVPFLDGCRAPRPAGAAGALRSLDEHLAATVSRLAEWII